MQGPPVAVRGRADGDALALARGFDRERREHGDAEPAGDEFLDGDEVVGLDGDARGEAGGVAEFEQVAAAARASGDPAFARQAGEVDALPAASGCRAGSTTCIGSMPIVLTSSPRALSRWGSLRSPG
ncbi:hypothetical protein GCM10025870_31460 [Agromyces marinus]|uniref:Uncharacterized protein n=1 Tax=Agromyces marinus TaxID=1389020 RepID=A0ABN6YKJ9_9MICO|nr:hypothetical protein GCM10025870_31460 [Agromyces marinus]